jgi:LysM repeat protein
MQPAATVSALPPKPEALRIVVRSGDNFGVLQRRYPGVTLKELYAANKGSDRIYPGQVLKIPR